MGCSKLGFNGFYSFDGTNWENYNTATHPEIGSSNWFQKITYGNGTVWAMGFGGGTNKDHRRSIWSTSTLRIHLFRNSGRLANFCSSYGGAFDNNGVFWVSFFRTNSGESPYAFRNNEWIGIPNPSIIGSSTLSQIAVDSYNTKWIVAAGTRSGVYFYNENGTIDNSSDDIFGIYHLADFGSEITNISYLIIKKQ